MNININDINKIMDCIKKESENFLRNDMSIDILEIKNIKKYTSKNHFSLIELNGHVNLFISLDIDDRLFDVLFHKFFKDNVTKEEKKELVNALANEIINIIVGLSIRNFPNKYKNLILGLPLETEDNLVFKNINTKLSSFCKITTRDGDLICSILCRDIN